MTAAPGEAKGALAAANLPPEEAEAAPLAAVGAPEAAEAAALAAKGAVGGWAGERWRRHTLGNARPEGKSRRLGRRLLPVHLKESASFGEGLKGDSPSPCRVHELHPHGAELLVADIE